MKVTLTCQGDKIRLIGSETRLICRARRQKRRALRHFQREKDGDADGRATYGLDVGDFGRRKISTRPTTIMKIE